MADYIKFDINEWHSFRVEAITAQVQEGITAFREIINS